MNWRSLRYPGLCILITLIDTQASSVRAADVLTQHNNNARTGAVLDEKVLTAMNVNSNKFGKLWTLYVDGQVVAQPLYVAELAVDTTANPAQPKVKGTFNAVILATMHNTIYVYNADKENRGPEGRTIPLWARWLGPPRPGSKDIDMWSTNDPEWGILGTPVVSDDRQTLYAVAWHNDNPGGFVYRLYAINLQNALDRHPPVIIGVRSTDASQPCKANSVFNPCLQKQRTALLLANGILYIAFGGDGNRGAVFAFDATTLAQKAFWSPTPSGNSRNGGIWQSGQGPAADSNGNVYFMIGNGTFNANTNNFGSSFVKLKLDGENLVVKDYFTPCNQDFLNRTDLDVGSAGPNLIPGNPPRIVSGGKEGVLYVLSRDNMGKYQPSATAPNCQNPNAVQEVKAFDPVVHDGQTHYGNIHGAPVFWQGPDTAWIYAWGENSHLKAYKFSGGRLQDTANPKISAFRPPNGMPGGMLSLSANGAKAGSGILWAVVPLDGDANQQRGVKGIVLALDAQDVSRTLWTSEQFAQRDRLGLFAKFCPPTIAAGKVFVPTYGDDEPRRTYPPNPEMHPAQLPKNYQVVVYGQLGNTDVHPTIVNQDKDDVAVVSANTKPLTLDINTCKAIDGTSVDCTDALARATGAPAFHSVVLTANTNISSCSLLEVRTASKRAAVTDSSGIGFYSSSMTGGNLAGEDAGLFVPKSQLKSVGNATLKNGQPATLHLFVGVANCQNPGSQPPGRVFKPYMQFENAANNNIYRNWALGPNDQIDSDTTHFDRSGQVLQ